MDESSQAIVVDTGSYSIKAGFTSLPRPNVVMKCTPTPQASVLFKESKTVTVKNKGDSNTYSTIQYPIMERQVYFSHEIELIWSHLFYNELKVATETHPFIMTEAISTPKAYREKMTQVMFELYNVPALYISNPSVLALYASGNATGSVVDSGYEMTHVSSIYEGYVIPQSVQVLNYGGREVTSHLESLISKKSSSLNRSIIQEIKEKLCFISANPYNEFYSYEDEVSYELPDGSAFTLGSERLNAPEILFRPEIINMKCDGFNEAVYKSIMACEEDVRRMMFNNIVLAGGNTMFGGIKDRLNADLGRKVNQSIEITAQPERIFSPWLGGCVMSSLSSFQHLWMIKEEYNEIGPGLVHQKCY
ncbi:unnamed protein product [Blepharisma stoltei]|uniref:Actin, cytoplasmic n=1 Tax=Blepharisma stoltei TaxID=1481888 RepID=A0AAU9JA76_9CILI|nr:unnamed protein product [Blepharisma stoltei]